jgi:hypothetical protein
VPAVETRSFPSGAPSETATTTNEQGSLFPIKSTVESERSRQCSWHLLGVECLMASSTPEATAREE